MTELRLSQNALTVLKKRYLAKDENGKPIETPEQMFHRVARNLALMDLLFVPEAYTPEPVSRSKKSRSETVDPSVSAALEEAGVTPQDLSTFRMAYDRLLEEGHMKMGFGEVLSLFPKYEGEIMAWEKRLYDLMADTDFMFNSPTLMNAGRDLQQLSACFVLPVDDDLGMIFEALKQAALIHQSGGGTGFSFSRLRPKNDIVRSTGGVASGPVSFMKVFNAATEAVKQGGTRRGANMGILRVDHPDILEFITCKSNGSEITNFNISVAITDEFMKALEEDREYHLVNPRNKEVTGRLRAQEVFELICENAWRNGDPGVVFIDRINRDNPTPLVGQIESTNPCFASETLISTDHGLERIDELYQRVGNNYCTVLTDDRTLDQVIAVNSRSYPVPGTTLRRARVFYTGRKPTIKVTLVNGQSIRTTPDHRLLTNRGWVRAGDLTSEDFVYTRSGPGIFRTARPSRKSTTYEVGVLKVEPAGICDVYDILEPVTHSVIANGIVAHNCGEQPLLPHEACTLGSINLGNFVVQGETPAIDFERLGQVVRDAIHALDNVLEANKYPIPEIERMVRANRKVGLGVMGWADMLLRMGIRYDSDKALDLARKVASFINQTAAEASAALAESRGVFPNWRGSIFDRPGGMRRRNATVTTIAPTGTISILAGASTGIEPLFSLAFTRHVLDGAKLVEVNPVFEEVARSRGFYSEDLVQKIARQGNLHGLDEVPEDVRELFVTAHDISPEWHVKMQAAFQEHTENAVSKTINMPHEATVGDVAEAYILAYKLGCKGITVYRDRSRETQVLTAGAKTTMKEEGTGTEKEVSHPDALERGEYHDDATSTEAGEVAGLNSAAGGRPAGENTTGSETTEHDRAEDTQSLHVNGGWGKIKPIPRPRRLHGITDVKETPLGKLFLTLNLLDGHPVELFAQIGKAGSDVSAFTEAIARLISLALRSGIAPEEVAGQLTGIGGARSVGFGPQRVRSVPDAIGQFISEFIKESQGAKVRFQSTPASPSGWRSGREVEGEIEGASRLNAGVPAADPSEQQTGKAQPHATAEQPSHAPVNTLSPDASREAGAAASIPGRDVASEAHLDGENKAAWEDNRQNKKSKGRSGKIVAGGESETAASRDRPEDERGRTSPHSAGKNTEGSPGRRRETTLADMDPSRSGSLFNLCPSCGIYAFAYVEGCSKCFACGYSEC